MSAPHLTPVQSELPDLEGLLLAQKKACLGDPLPDRATRVRRLDKLHNALLDNRQYGWFFCRLFQWPVVMLNSYVASQHPEFSRTLLVFRISKCSSG